VPANVFYMKQHAVNACGTIALFHIVLNAHEQHPAILQAGSFLEQFLQNAHGKDSAAKAEIFKNSKNIQS
jgi:ubiquitin carboxyl-terminal hydrolase L3